MLRRRRLYKAGLVCDELLHLRKNGCRVLYDALNDCGEEGWCMPSEGYGLAGDGVCCSEGHRCDVLDPKSCDSGGDYTLTCVPLDLDTAARRLAGEVLAGQSCAYVNDGSNCAPGLDCSPMDFICYQICELGKTEIRSPDTSRQLLNASRPDRFGLCR